MTTKPVTPLGAVATLVILVGCEKASPTRPSDVDTAPASMTDARTGATIIAARPLSPPANAQISYAEQPITLSVSNGTTTGASPLTYTFEVAGDAGFARKDYTRDNVASGANGTTSLMIDRLGGGRTYYWRVRADSATGPGPYSTVRTFTLGPEVVLGTPILSSPVNSAAASSPLLLTIINIPRTGPAGPVVYEVQVSADEGFANRIFTSEVPEQPRGQTTITAAVGLVDGTMYFWRARAADRANNITTPYSTSASFVARSFNIQTARFWDNPPDTGSWPVGAKITHLEFTGFSMRVDFDRRDGPNRWPDVVPPGWAGPIQYTLGICRNIVGQWHCSAVVHFWYGRSLDDTAPPNQFWREWWYDGARWGPLANNPPPEGELIGVFVVAGDVRQRSFTRGTCPRVCEISNVALVPFTSGYARYEF